MFKYKERIYKIRKGESCEIVRKGRHYFTFVRPVREKMEKQRMDAKYEPIDTSLVERAKKGDGTAFSNLYELMYKDMYRFAFYLLKNQHDAEDAVSEAVLAAYHSISGLKDNEAFRSWINRILINKCRDHFKKMEEYPVDMGNGTYQEGNTYLENQTYPNHSVYGNNSNNEQESVNRKLYIRQLMQEYLTQEERLIISMHVFLGYKTSEIASELNMNENTVRSKESRAFGKLKKEALK